MHSQCHVIYAIDINCFILRGLHFSLLRNVLPILLSLKLYLYLLS